MTISCSSLEGSWLQLGTWKWAITALAAFSADSCAALAARAESTEDKLTKFVKALIKQLKVSPEDFISFLKVMSLSEYGSAHFKVGELEMQVYRGFGGLSFEVKWYQQGVKRSIEYDLTRLSSIVKLMSRIKEGEERVANP